jgi:hypothetical protein
MLSPGASQIGVRNCRLLAANSVGGLAGATSRTVVSPLERLKIILQCQSMGSQKAAAGQAYTGVWPSLVRMYKQEGFAGFMKGNGINVVRVRIALSSWNLALMIDITIFRPAVYS